MDLTISMYESTHEAYSLRLKKIMTACKNHVKSITRQNKLEQFNEAQF